MSRFAFFLLLSIPLVLAPLTASAQTSEEARPEESRSAQVDTGPASGSPAAGTAGAEKTGRETTDAQPEGAESDESAAGAVKDEIVVVAKYLYSDKVTALKTPTPIIDVPQSLSITTSDQLAAQGFTSIGELVSYTPGVNTSQGEGHRDAIVFRGVRSTADFFIDGVRDDVQYYRPLYNLDQIEILRGPNALLFGRGGTGGILNRVTKKGLPGSSFSSYEVSFDSQGETGVQIDSNFSVSDNQAFRINAFYEGLDNHRDFYDGDRIGFNPTFKVLLSPNTTLDLSYEYADHQRFVDRGIPTGSNGRPVEAFEDVVFGDRELNTTELEAHLLRARLQHIFSDSLKGNFSAFYGDYDKLYQNFYASAYDEATDIVELDGYLDTTQRENMILSADLIKELNTGDIRHTFVFGAEYIDTSSDQDRFNSYFDTSAADGTSTDRARFLATRPIDLTNGVGTLADGRTTRNDFSIDLNDDTRVGVEVISLYVQDEIALSDSFDITLGARFDSFDIEVFNVPANEVRTRKDEEVSPRLGLVYKPKENVSLYASYSESFLPRSGEQYANINGDNNRLDPNTFVNTEAGLKWDLDSGLSITAAVFEIEQESPVVSDADVGTFDIIETTVDGFEVQLQGLVTGRWFISAGYSYLDGEQADGVRRPRELPENMFSVWNSFRVTDRFSLGLGLIHQDESFINNSNTAVLPSYTRIDAAAYFNVTDTLRVQLNVENLADELYFPNAHSTHQATVGAPLNARLSIRGQF